MLPRNAAVNISSRQKNHGRPLSASRHLTIAASPSNALIHTSFLRRVGAGVLELHSRLKTVALVFIYDVLITFVRPQALDTEPLEITTDCPND